jgi:hypothetical protein
VRNRTLAVIAGTLVAAGLALGTLGSALAQTPAGPGGWGPGMVGGHGQGYGPGGMMGRGMMGGGAMGGYGPGGMMGAAGPGTATPLRSLDEAETAFRAYVDRTGNRDLALDEVMEFERNYYAIVQEQSTGSGAFELLADKGTGIVFPEYGPNMMWNTKYSHMGARGTMMGGFWPVSPAVQPTVTADQARQTAQQWLDANLPGSGVETPDAFPGYYTVHTTKDGAISGMLSVNASTGQVWYHSWHGAFVASREEAH